MFVNAKSNSQKLLIEIRPGQVFQFVSDHIEGCLCYYMMGENCFVRLEDGAIVENVIDFEDSCVIHYPDATLTLEP